MAEFSVRLQGCFPKARPTDPHKEGLDKHPKACIVTINDKQGNRQERIIISKTEESAQVTTVIREYGDALKVISLGSKSPCVAQTYSTPESYGGCSRNLTYEARELKRRLQESLQVARQQCDKVPDDSYKVICTSDIAGLEEVIESIVEIQP
jgi:prephenate dehydratase